MNKRLLGIVGICIFIASCGEDSGFVARNKEDSLLKGQLAEGVVGNWIDPSDFRNRLSVSTGLLTIEKFGKVKQGIGIFDKKTKKEITKEHQCRVKYTSSVFFLRDQKSAQSENPYFLDAVIDNVSLVPDRTNSVDCADFIAYEGKRKEKGSRLIIQVAPSQDGSNLKVDGSEYRLAVTPKKSDETGTCPDLSGLYWTEVGEAQIFEQEWSQDGCKSVTMTTRQYHIAKAEDKKIRSVKFQLAMKTEPQKFSIRPVEEMIQASAATQGEQTLPLELDATKKSVIVLQDSIQVTESIYKVHAGQEVQKDIVLKITPFGDLETTYTDSSEGAMITQSQRLGSRQIPTTP